MARISNTKGGKIVAGKVGGKYYGTGTFVPTGSKISDFGKSEQGGSIAKTKTTAKEKFAAIESENAQQQYTPWTNPKKQNAKNQQDMKERGMISSEQGKNKVKEADKSMDRFAPEPISADPTQPITKAGVPAPISATTPAPTTSAPATTPAPAATTPDTSTDFVTLYNQTTGQEKTLRGAAANPTNINAALKDGYSMAVSDTSTAPESPTSTQIKKVEGEVGILQNTINAYTSKLESTLITDKELRGEIRTISKGYNARIADAQEITERRKQTINTLGTRLGARYTGGMGGILGGIISEEERQGLARITAIENEKQKAISDAKTEARNYNYSAYTKLMAQAEKLQEDKKKELTTLKEAQRLQDEKIAEEKQQAEYDSLIVEQLSTGVTDPLQIVRALGGKVPFDQIKAITDLMPKQEDFTLGEGQARYDATGKLIAARAKTYKPEGGGGVVGGIPITPIGKPIVAGIGSSYEKSSFEAQMLMDEILNKIPVQLRNTEKESELKMEQIRKQLAAGYSYQQIVDRISGFSLQGKADKSIGQALYDVALGTDIEAGTLASMLNRGANVQAMTTVENAKLKDAEGFFSKTDKARATISQADTVLSILNDPDFPKDALGSFDGRAFKVTKFFGLDDAQRAKVQKLETALQLLAAPIRVEVAGTAATADEMAKISAFQSDILDQPDTIQVQVEGLRDSVLGFHNQARSQRGLPEATKDQVIDNNKRLDLYRAAQQEEEQAMTKNLYDTDFLKRGVWNEGALSTPMSALPDEEFFSKY